MSAQLEGDIHPAGRCPTSSGLAGPVGSDVPLASSEPPGKGHLPGVGPQVSRSFR